MEHFTAYVSRLWGSTLVNRLAWAIAIAVVFELLTWLATSRIRRALAPVLQREIHLPAAERVRRRKIVLGLPLALTRSLIFIVAIFIIVRYLGFDTSAELVPFAIALLAAALLVFWRPCQDAARGYFLMYHDLFAPGDRITVGEVTGTVLDMGLLHTHLRGADGREVTLANSTITTVTNHSRSAELEKRAQRQ